jgi:hypothetical protein
VRLDLAKLSYDVAFRPGRTPQQTAAEVRALLERRGWVESDGWWTAPSQAELRLRAYGITQWQMPRLKP